MPCETQPPITNLSAPTSGPIHQVGAGSPLPTLPSLPLAERKAVVNNALKVVDSAAKTAGLKVHLPKGLP